jgi:tetratricopeptide (TPR) repeat protein
LHCIINNTSIRQWRRRLIFACVLCTSPSQAQDGFCDLSFNNRTTDFYEYSSERADKVGIVESYHLTTDMLLLRKGATSSIAGDVDYTLGRIPNHPKALDLVSRLQSAIDSGIMPSREKLRKKVDCYFARAVAFNAGIGETYYIWGLHLQRAKDLKRAHEMYEKALSLGQDSSEFYYNYGLLFFSDKKYEDATIQANKAYSMGFPLGGLRNKLKSKGYITDTN